MTLNSGEILLQCHQTRHRSHWNAHYSSRSTKTENGRRDATKAKFYLALNGLKNKVEDLKDYLHNVKKPLKDTEAMLSKECVSHALSKSSRISKAACCNKHNCKVSYLGHMTVLKSTYMGLQQSNIVMGVDRELWELCCNSHAITMQWVYMVVDPLLSTCT